MNDFDFWYAYFDSLFLKPKPVPHIPFLQKINIKYYLKHPFPQCRKLPQLSKCFQGFQKFLFSEETWIQSECEQTFLKETENNFNLIAVLINAEKKYGQDFWHCKRRIQASVCHFFAIFVYFIFSFFPKQDTRETLESLKSTNRLCTSLKALEELVNLILQEIHPIIQFLYQETFAEQKKLTIKMFQQIRQILMDLPTLNKKKFKHQFELSKYLYVIIPIELSKNEYQLKIKRKKIFTISNDVQFKYHSDETVSTSTKKQEKRRIEECGKRLSLQKSTEKTLQSKFRTKILKRFPSKDNSIGQQSMDLNTNGEESMPKIFKLSQKIRKYSFYLAQKKFTKSTLQTNQTAQPRYFFNKQRKISDFGNTSSSPSKDKDHSRTISNEKHRNLTNQTIRSKKSSYQKIHHKAITEQSQNFRHHKQKSMEKSKHKNGYPTNVILSKPSHEIPLQPIPTKRINIYSGQVSGWGIIQEQLKKKIAVKKIQQLIHSKEHG